MRRTMRRLGSLRLPRVKGEEYKGTQKAGAPPEALPPPATLGPRVWPRVVEANIGCPFVGIFTRESIKETSQISNFCLTHLPQI